MEYHALSRFAFSNSKLVKIKCVCGFVKLTVNAKTNNSYYWLKVPCIICETQHLIKVSASKFWSEDIATLYCDETGLELACIGSAEKIKEHKSSSRGEIEALVGNFWGDDYFNNAQVMYETLNCLHDIAEKGQLYCQCGNKQISVDVFPDRLELYCSNCDTVNTIFANANEDLEIISQAGKIELVQNRPKCLDSLTGRDKNRRGYKRPKN